MYSIFSFVFLLALMNPSSAALDIQFDNVEQAKGSLHLAVFDNANHFSDRSPVVYESEIPIHSTDPINVQIPNLEAGKTYSIAAYHDVNNNGELDTNWLGIPTEPYAFSNNPKVKWQAPTFEETAFKAGANAEMRLHLATWSEQ